MPMTNEERAEYAAAAADAYSNAKEGQPDYDTPEDIAADLICDLLHLIRAHDADPIKKLKSAVTNFLCEEEGGDGADMLLEPGGIISQAETLELVRTVARMNYDGEELPDGTEFLMENDDAVSTLGSLIEQARSIVGVADDAVVRDDPDNLDGLDDDALRQKLCDPEHIGRILGIVDQFMEDWEQNEGKDDHECQERLREIRLIRPLLLSSPALYHAVKLKNDAIDMLLGRITKDTDFQAVKAAIRPALQAGSLAVAMVEQDDAAAFRALAS